MYVQNLWCLLVVVQYIYAPQLLHTVRFSSICMYSTTNTATPKEMYETGNAREDNCLQPCVTAKNNACILADAL